jgi:hypothetical protein
MNTYEKCCAIRHAIMTRVAESQIYESWSDEFRLKNIRGFFSETIQKWSETESFEIDASDLTKEEMELLGFCKFSENSNGYLIPIWLYPFLKESIETSCIDGSSKLNKSEMDTDHRFGYLAYSVLPKDYVYKESLIEQVGE